MLPKLSLSLIKPKPKPSHQRSMKWFSFSLHHKFHLRKVIFVLLLIINLLINHHQVESYSSSLSTTRTTTNTFLKMTTTTTTPSSPIPFVPPPNLKGVLVGSGSDGLNEPAIARAILRLATSNMSSNTSCDGETKEEDDEEENDNDDDHYQSSTNSTSSNNNNNSGDSEEENDDEQDTTNTVNVLYLGTATYDQPGPMERQTSQILEQCDGSTGDGTGTGTGDFGNVTCHIESLDIVDHAPPIEELEAAVDKADVIVASGGNTLFAVDRWKALGLDSLLESAMERGAVLTGGSAGAICWFQGGHSDSMDPASFKATVTAPDGKELEGFDEEGKSNTDDDDDEESEEWEYIRIDGLGFLPALTCPHYDRIQSNGIVRGKDFETRLLQHSTELGIGIDHWAALEINDGRYRVISIPGKKRLGGGGNENDNTGSNNITSRPGVWIKKVIDGRVHTRRCPNEGDLGELLSSWPTEIVPDPRVEVCRMENPDDGPRPPTTNTPQQE